MGRHPATLSLLGTYAASYHYSHISAYGHRDPYAHPSGESKEVTMNLEKQMERLYKKHEKQIREIGRLFLEAFDRAEVNADKVAPLLEQANFWISPSMDLHLLHELGRISESEDATPNDVVAAFVRYYEDNEWAALNCMVHTWQDNPCFEQRMHIIHDALESHIDGKYTLTVPTLLTQVEGIASSILGVPAGPSTSLVKSAIINLGKEAFIGNISKDIIINFVTSPMGYGGVGRKDSEYFTPEKFPEWLNLKGVPESQSVNRHAILHGVHLNYASKENSLRVFLLLDIFHVLRREDWDSRLQILRRRSGE